MKRLLPTFFALVPLFATATPCKRLLSSREDLILHTDAIKRSVKSLWNLRRIEKDLTQVQAARALGISQSHFSRLLRPGNSSTWTRAYLSDLADLMEVRVNRLLPSGLELASNPAEFASAGCPSDWTRPIQDFYALRGKQVSAAQVRFIAAEAAYLCGQPRYRKRSKTDVIMAAVLEVSLKLRPGR